MQTVWLLTGRAICLWALEATSSSITQERSINLLRQEYDRLLPLAWLPQMLWLLTAETICLSQMGSPAVFLSLLRAGCEPPLPPDSLQLWLSSQRLRQ